jgi:NitT/TauT family transport system substrate-binding protein
MMRRSTFAGLTLAAMAAPARAQTATTLRVSTGTAEVGALQFYAADLGLYVKAGLDVQLMPAQNGPANAAAVASGSLDIGSGNALATAQARERGIPFVYVSPSGEYTSAAPTAGLVVPKNSPARTAADLSGKTIAVATLGSLGEIATRAWLDQHHVDLKTVKFVELPFPAMDVAIATGHVDAAAVEEPLLSRILAGDAKPFADIYDAIADRFSEGGSFTTEDFVRTHTPALRRFAAVMAETARWANANPAASAVILQKYTGIDVSQERHRVHFADRLDPRQLQPLIDVAAKYGTLKASFPASQLIASL